MSDSEYEAVQETFDEMLAAADRKADLERQACLHCFITVFDPKTEMVSVVCAHKCGTVKSVHRSWDHRGDREQARRTQEAFMFAHARGGCPRRR